MKGKKNVLIILIIILLSSYLQFIPISLADPDSGTFYVSHSYDDAYEKGIGTFSYIGDLYEIRSNVAPATKYYVCSGLRFLSVTIPQGSTINSANVTMWSFHTAFDDINTKIYANDVDNAQNFFDNQHIINETDRPRTTEYISWIQDSLGTGWKTKTGLESIIQEIVNREGWSSGNAIVLLFISNTDIEKYSAFNSYDNDPSYASQLGITWTSELANILPVNDQVIISNLEDVDNMYAQKGWYDVEYDGHDEDGYADIDYVEVRFKQGAITRAIFRFDEDINTFSIESGSDKWDLNVSSSSYQKSGNNLNATFKVKPQWDAVEESDLEIECYIVDDEPENDTDVMQTDYFDVVTNLVPSSIEGNDPDVPDRVNINSTVQIDFSVRYADNPSSSDPSSFYPQDVEFNNVSIYDSVNNNKGTDNTIVNGVGSVSITSELTVKSELYNLYIDMSDNDYSDGEEALTEQIISDRIMVYWEQLTDLRVNVNDNIEGRYKTVLDYDDHLVGVTDVLNCSWDSLSWDAGNEWWKIYHSESSVLGLTIGGWTGIENTYNITIVNENITEITYVYDRHKIVVFGTNNTNPDVNETVLIYAQVESEYDGHVLGSGDELVLKDKDLNQYSMSYNGTYWNITKSESEDITRIINTYHNMTEVTYGITLLNMNEYVLVIAWGEGGVEDVSVIGENNLNSFIIFISAIGLMLIIVVVNKK